MSTTIDQRVLVLADVIIRMPSVGILITQPRDLGPCMHRDDDLQLVHQTPEPASAVVISWPHITDPDAERWFIHIEVCAEHLADQVNRDLEAEAVVRVEIPAISPAVTT